LVFFPLVDLWMSSECEIDLQLFLFYDALLHGSGVNGVVVWSSRKNILFFTINVKVSTQCVLTDYFIILVILRCAMNGYGLL
jgi:hypothetical protein